MRIGRGLALCLVLFGLGACGRDDGGGSGGGGGGGGGDGGGTPLPVRHVLAQSQPVTLSAGSNYGFNFLLPKEARFSFSASETTTDTWNVAVFTPTQWVSYMNGSGNQAYDGVHNNVMQVSDSVTLPKGEWYLGFRCTNSFQRCMFVFNADATY
jgi:hypothetical protein